MSLNVLPLEITHLLTWDGNSGVGLLAKGLERLPFKNSDGSDAYRIARLVGPSVLVNAFFKAFGGLGGGHTLTAKTTDGAVAFEDARVVLDQFGSDDFPYVEAVDMSVVDDVRFRVFPT